jgi:DNA repair protein RecO (recombination protein O)
MIRMSIQERLRKVEAIVTSHSDYGEADRLLTLFTREMGKVRAIAKGIRKSHSRKAGHLEPFTCVTLMLARGSSFWIVSQAETVEAFPTIRIDLEKTAQAAYILELLERFTSEAEEHHALYRLVKDTLFRLAGDEDSFYAMRYFELRFLERVGYRPEIFQCVQCRKEIQPEDQYFSAFQGGVLCPHCGEMTANVKPISMSTLKYLRYFQRSDYDQVRTVNIRSAQREEMEKLMQYYFTYLAERKLNTPEFLREIRQSKPNHKTETK